LSSPLPVRGSASTITARRSSTSRGPRSPNGGYSGTSVSDLTDATGLGKGALHRYIESKENHTRFLVGLRP
jgi:hypothetical protein